MTDQNNASKNRIVIALGDPAGIGTEVTLKALGSKNLPKHMQPILVGCKKTTEIIYTNLKNQGITSLANPKNLYFENIPFHQKVHAGLPSKETGSASFLYLTHATKLVLEGKARALVTAPISKEIWHLAGHQYPGQTERLGEIAGVKNPSMLFTAKSPYTKWRLNTLLATTHIPLKDVSKNLTPDLIIAKLDSLLDFCSRFNKTPKLSIAGLNPHAGENGKLGLEEIEWIIPLLEKWRKKHPNIKLEGPVSPDICWIASAKSWHNELHKNAPDGILALYHDQGLIPIKLLAFDSAVNTTLELPFIRTSPDHGTGFDIADKGVAREESMFEALKTAWELSA